jgi:hypothetical protein
MLKFREVLKLDFVAFANNMTVPAIAIIAFFVGLCVKKSPLDDKWLPCIVGGVGGILGAVGLFTLPDFPVNNVLAAIAVGIASGLAATGGHQIYKQLFDPQEILPEENNDPDCSLTWEKYKADQGSITILANEEEATTNGDSD